MDKERGRDLIPPSLDIREKQEFPSILEKLGLSKRALDWKLAVRDLEMLEAKYPDTMQEVLDYVSPVKSPIRGNSISNTSNPVVNEDYTFIQSEILGEGTSKVKLARHIKTGRMVAIKVFEKSQLWQQHSNLLREIMVLGGLYHPHINPILQVIDSMETVYMVVKLEKGGDLFSYIQKNDKLSENESVFIFRQVLSAVHFLHGQGVIHRDIKPENILMDESHTHVTLCDFGFSSVYDPNRLFEEFCGSPEYAAPEMIGGKPYSGPEVDVWSLGVLLFAMLTGCLPFPEQKKSKLFLSIMTATFTVPAHVSESASSLIKSILVPQISKRYSLAQIFSHPFISSNPAPILINSINFIPPIHPEIRSNLLELGYTEREIHEYETRGQIGPVKAAVYLLEENFAPRLSKNHQNSETQYDPSKHNKPGNGYIKESQSYIDNATSAMTPLSGIKSLFQDKQEVEDDMNTDDNSNLKQHPLIIATFQHQSTRQLIHSTILQKIINLKGRIPELKDDDPNTMIFELTVKRKTADTITNLFAWSEADDGMDVDPEIQACFQEPQEPDSNTIKVSVTTFPVPHGDHQTVFQLLQYDHNQPWILDQFDDFCLDLMKDTSGWSIYPSS